MSSVTLEPPRLYTFNLDTAKVTLDGPPLVPVLKVDPQIAIRSAYQTLDTAGPTMTRALEEQAAATTASYTSQALAEYRRQNILVRFAGPATSVGSMLGVVASLEGTTLGLLAYGTAFAASAGLALVGVGSAVAHHIKRSKQLEQIADDKRRSADATIDATLRGMLDAAKTDPASAFVYSQLAFGLTHRPPKGFVVTIERRAALDSIWRTYDTRSVDAARVLRLSNLQARVSEALAPTGDEARGTYSLDRVRSAFEQLQADEQSALAPEITNKLFDERECLRGSGSVAVGRKLFARLVAAGGRALPVVAPPPAPEGMSPIERFASQILALEHELGSALVSDTRSLASAASALPNANNVRKYDWGRAIGDGEWGWLTSMLSLAPRKSSMRFGLDPERVAAALARARAPWATPLERAGFAFVTQRFYDLVKRRDIACTLSEKALSAVVQSDRNVSAAERAEAQRLCRAVFLLNETRPGMHKATSKEALLTFRALSPAEQSAVARAVIPHVFVGDVVPSASEPRIAEVARALYDALEQQPTS